MRNFKIYLIVYAIFLVSLLTACNLPETTQSPASRMNDIQTEAALQITPVFKTPTITASPSPTKTQIPSTPTAYPTFYPELAVTVTHPPQSICPPENPDYKFNFAVDDMSNMEKSHENFSIIFNEVQRAMDNDIPIPQIYSEVKRYYPSGHTIYLAELTGDLNPEMIIFSGQSNAIYTCVNQKIENVYVQDEMQIYAIEDLNMDGVAELVTYGTGRVTGDLVLVVYEWNGTEFESKLVFEHGPDARSTSRIANGLLWNMNLNGFFHMNCGAEITISDVDHNGTKEIVLKDEGPCHMQTYYENGPWLGQQVTFTWNGESFLLSDYQIDVPYYRYQALQEADRLFLMRDYDQASILYDKVVGSEMLEWYSLDRKKYFWDVYSAKQAGKDPSKVTLPYFRADEYQYLSAYARYRKMMMLLAEGKQADAYYVYQLLDQIYTQQNPGFWHAEMGRIYWKAVEEGMSLTDACQPVIEYVEQNPKLLEALGDQWHGQQSHIYIAADVCPLDELDIALLSEKP